MARPVEIDRDRAFEVAFQLFWHRGYRSTSLQQLLDAMEIGKSSFYAAFASKEALFVDVLSYYWTQTQAVFSRIRLKRRGLEAIREFLNETLLNVSDTDRRKGCLAVNSALEMAGVNQELHDRAGQILNKLEVELRSLLTEAQAIGEVRPDQSPRELAQLLIVMLQGLRVSSRRGMTRPQARAAVGALMQLLDYND